jgi:glycerol-3-phosphate cytidylyltransferase
MTKNKTITGYTTGIYDLFHVGHLNILKYARTGCDRLIVGVTTDELAFKLKGRKPIIPFGERIEIIRSLRFVDEAVAEDSDDKFQAWEKLRFDVVFKGDDWKGSDKWNKLQERFKTVGVEVVFFPYTQSTSSTIIRSILEERIIEKNLKM